VHIFEFLAYKGLETGERGVVSHVISHEKGTVFVFSSVYQKDSCKEMNDHLINHGDGARDIALTVENATAIYEHSVKNGGVSIMPPP